MKTLTFILLILYVGLLAWQWHHAHSSAHPAGKYRPPAETPATPMNNHHT